MNVEIQVTNKYDIIKRSIYYWAGVYRAPVKPRMGYKELRTVIAINILNFTIFDQTERFHTTYHLYEDKEIAGFSIINDFNKQFSPNMKGHITIEELEKQLKWCTFPPTRANADELFACKHIIVGALLEKHMA